MLSSFTAITAGVLAVAIGGLVFIAQPFGEQQAAAPAATSGDSSSEFLFAVVEEPNSGNGEFTGSGSIPSGTISRAGSSPWRMVAGETAPAGYSSTIVFDPGEPGGDTFEISYSGQLRATLGDDVAQGVAFWNVVPGSGTGEYADLTGKGRLIGFAHGVQDGDFDPEGDWSAMVFLGQIGPATE